ncbi:MAG TPA: endolytic transglycosylase MltG [Chthonomonadaceae bacterium]|nr:endolytic transglycosylase MltG [Chthonomonadaceae bacterium]
MSVRGKQPELIETPARKARAVARRRWRRWITGLVLGLLVAAALAVAGLLPLFRPISTTPHPREVRIPSGVTVARIGQLLERRGVIRSALAFDWYVRWRGVGDRLKAGRYELSGDMTLDQIISALQTGGMEDRIKVTIPEGYTLKQIAEALEAKGIADARAFLKQATDPEGIAECSADFPLPRRSLEGYLFPDTYAFPPHTPPVHILNTMLLNFSRRFVRPYQQEIASSGRSLHAIVTEASLIEREARVPEDRARIAGVLENRLKQGMRLEVDATVLYALGHHKDQVLYKDLQVNSPYNTYRHTGLPPGPIANPGLEALRAALHPEKNDFLYYVARPNGQHIFTRSLVEHEAAKRQARLERQQESAKEASPGG